MISLARTRRRRILATVLATAGVLVTATGVTAAVLTGAASALPGAPPALGEGTADPLTAEDGLLPDGTRATDELAGVSRLDPALLAALRAAAADAAAQGVTIHVTSGWRSPRHQDALLRDAARLYASVEEAARWVAPADRSLHVSGDAVDIGSWDAMDWLAENGARLGLCRVYDNEPWHFELFPEAADIGCPATFFDPTDDPRLR